MLDISSSSLLAGSSHGFLGRSGGASEGIYAGLNVGLGSDDDREIILENRRRAKEGVLPGSELVTVHQVHSAEVVTVTGSIPLYERPHVDAMVTDQHGLLLGILTADCVPVLFFDPKAKIVGAAHAGWKGAIAGVTDNTIGAMEVLGANRDHIACAIGPCIAQDSYEVDAGFQERFVEADGGNKAFFGPENLDIISSISKVTLPIGWKQQVLRKSKNSVSTPMPMKIDSTATAAPAIAGRMAMAGRFR